MTPDASTSVLVQTVVLLNPMLHQLRTTTQQLPQLLAVGIHLRLRRLRLREHHAVARQRLGTERVGLRLVTTRSGEGAHSKRMRYLHCELRLTQIAHQ